MRTLEQQLATINRLALQHFPDDYQRQLEYRLEKTTERLREIAFRINVLPVKEMPDDGSGR